MRDYIPDYSNFSSDKYLKGLADSINTYEVISFDVFDALLFRTVYDPVDVFLTLGKHMQEEFPEYRETPLEVIKNLRMEAQRRAHEKARQNGLEDVPLEKIYDELHIWCEHRNRIIELEMQSECEHIYVNPHMYSFALHCHKQGKKLAITSDFYFSEVRFRSLLEYACIDCNIFSVILVSGEHGALKGSGKLFKHLLDAFPNVEPEKILHIGDNQWSDIVPAHKLGLRTFWYSIIPETRSSELDMERVCYGSTLGALNSLRELAMNTLPEGSFDEDGLFWFREGCGIIGPVYALFAEWVVDTAIKENIKHLLTFMREGELLAEVIGRAAVNRGIDLHIVPVFVSRRSTALLAASDELESTLESYFSLNQLRVRHLFEQFYLDIEKTPFESIGLRFIADCKKDGSFDEVRKYIFLDSTLSQIREHIDEQRALFLEYIHSFIGEDDAITIDLSCKGSLQNNIFNILDSFGYKNNLLHLVAIGHAQNAKLLVKGIKMRGWLGYAGENMDLIRSIDANPAPLEAIINSNSGSTAKYVRGSSGVLPVTAISEFTPEDILKKEFAWRGIHCFQSLWFDLSNKKQELQQRIISDKRGFLSVLSRLLLMPTSEEVQNFGGISFDDSDMQNSSGKTISQEDLTSVISFGQKGISTIVSRSLPHSLFWRASIPERLYPKYNIIEYFRQKYLPKGIAADASALNAFAVLSLNKDTLGKTAIYGLGIKGRMLAEIMWLFDRPADILVDKTVSSLKVEVYCAKLMSPSDSVGFVDTYIISSAIHARDIIDDILKLYAGRKMPKILLNGELRDTPDVI